MGSQSDRKTPRAILERDYREAILRIAQLERDQNESTDLQEFAFAEAAAIARQPGYFRMGVQGKSGECWASWKWTSGTHAGHYTYASAGSMEEALAIVCSHVLEIEVGKRKATKDTAYIKKMAP